MTGPAACAHYRNREVLMNNEELKGKLENLKGRAKEAFGTITGNKKDEAEGIADRVEGAAREKSARPRKSSGGTARKRSSRKR